MIFSSTTSNKKYRNIPELIESQVDLWCYRTLNGQKLKFQTVMMEYIRKTLVVLRYKLTLGMLAL